MNMTSATAQLFQTIAKALLLSSLFLLFTNTSNAQGWQEIYLEGKSLRGEDIIQTPDGGFMALSIKEEENGDYRTLMAKIDPEGAITWTKTLAHPDGRTFPKAIDLCANGDYIISGGFNHPDFPTVTNGSKPYLVRTDPAGNIIWQNWYGTQVLTTETEFYESVHELPDGSFIAAGTASNNPPFYIDGIITKVDANGNELWTIITDGDKSIRDMIPTSDGNFVLVGTHQGVTDHSLLMKIDPDGNELWTQAYQTPSYSYGNAVAELPDGSLVLTGNNNTSDTMGLIKYNTFLIKTTSDGDSLWLNNYDFYSYDENGRDVGVMPDGGFVITGFTKLNGFNGQTSLIKTDPNGIVEWSHLYGTIEETNAGWDLEVCANGGIIISGHNRINNQGNALYLIKTDDLGNVYARFIEGNVAGDLNDNCIIDNDEPNFENWMVTASNDDHTFYTTTDANGDYFLEIAEGTYELNVNVPVPYWESCIDDVIVNIPQTYDTIRSDFPMSALVECTYLTVDVGTPFIRWCSDSYYSISFCNEGTIPADDVNLEVDLDTFLTLNNSNYPIVNQNGNTYTFSVGNLEVAQCGALILNVELGCDVAIQGFTHCTEAHIFPDTLCAPFNMNWDGSSIEVEGFCEDDSIRFLIHNVGNEMQGPNTFFVIEDQIMLLQGTFTLGAGEDTTIVLAATGGTFRIQAEQSEGHPGNNMPSSVVEGCGDSPFSLGFVNNFAHNDHDNFVDIDCNTNIFAFDPNDKQGLPLGYGSAHFIYPETDIDYRIRFQNTGTDTAFHVVIRDTLSPYLDINSIDLGASSHDFIFDVVGDGVLKFTFNNIALPDSNVNEAASHGFVKFKISPFSDIDLGTQIYNRAGIYFGANLPVMTNTTLHTIQEDFIEIMLLPTENINETNAALKVYPNPFTDYTTIELEERNFTEGVFTLYHSNGQLAQQIFFEEKQFQLYAKGLTSGIYFYEITTNQQNHYQGKLIVNVR